MKRVPKLTLDDAKLMMAAAEQRASDIDVDMDMPDLDAPSLFTQLFAWLRVGKVPILILMLIFLSSFTISGLVIQKSALASNAALLPNWLSALMAFFVSLPVVRYLGVTLETIMPKDESSAVSRESFIGQKAIITTGIAKANYPAEARLTDAHGQNHYVMVEPEQEIEIKQGEWVKLIKSRNAIFMVEPITAV